jgi:hypothetical protein
MRHLVLVSGKDSLAAALVQTTRHPSLTYEFLFNDVRTELPETYEWLTRVEAKTGWKIERVGKSLPEAISRYGGFLPSPRARYCTKECKIEPTEDYIGADDCTVYYGLRADEQRIGYVPIGKPNITPAYPLIEAGVDLQGVYAILDAQGLTPPDFLWPKLHLAVSEKMGGGMARVGAEAIPDRAAHPLRWANQGQLLHVLLPASVRIPLALRDAPGSVCCGRVNGED